MSFLINYGLFLVAWLVGVGVGAFTIGQIVILTSYGIPLAVRLKNKGLFANYWPVFRYIISVFINLVEVVVCLLIVGWYFPYLTTGFLFGMGVVSYKINKEHVRKSPANLDDFLENNQRYFTKSIDELDGYEQYNLFDIDDKDSLEGNEVFVRLVGETISNTLSYGVLVVVIF